MGCPYQGTKVRPAEPLLSVTNGERKPDGSMRVNLTTLLKDPESGMLYGEYLMLEKLLACQEPVTRSKFTAHRKEEVHDELLFIIIHQIHELKFKLITFELDSVRKLLNNDQVDEVNMLKISSRLDRVRKIFASLQELLSILETMTPLDFIEFRDYLAPASGFQSYQFRLIENKLGVRNQDRSNHRPNQVNQPYMEVFKDPKIIQAISESEREPSLFELIQRWLERTPGLERNGFNFLDKYKDAVDAMLGQETEIIEAGLRELQSQLEAKEVDEEEAKSKERVLLAMRDDVEKKKLIFKPIIDEKEFKDRKFRFSHKAMLGALMISLYRDEPRFNQPYQLLVTLMDIDSLLTKWRSNHAHMVRRMIGSDTLGTGGSSGYSYLQSTLSSRYNFFLDLCNLSTYLLPKERIPELTDDMRRRLSTIDELQ